MPSTEKDSGTWVLLYATDIERHGPKQSGVLIAVFRWHHSRGMAVILRDRQEAYPAYMRINELMFGPFAFQHATPCSESNVPCKTWQVY